MVQAMCLKGFVHPAVFYRHERVQIDHWAMTMLPSFASVHVKDLPILETFHLVARAVRPAVRVLKREKRTDNIFEEDTRLVRRSIRIVTRLCQGIG